jgi:hypothetical protein
MADDIENVDDAEPVEAPAAVEHSTLTLPFILTLAALSIYFGFQTVHLLNERSNLAMVKSTQEAAIQEAQKIQTQFKTLVSKTGELADQGHAGAKMVMEELFKRGVSSAPQSTAPETKAPAIGTKPAK